MKNVLRSDRVAQRHLDHKVDRFLSEGIPSDCQWDQTIQKREQSRRLSSVLGPINISIAVRVEVVDEMDKVVLHLATTIDIEDVRSVDLMI